MRLRRIKFLRPVHVRVVEGNGPTRRLFASNLSTGGMYIRTPQPYAKGTRVELLLEAKGRILPFAFGEVAFEMRPDEAKRFGRLPGFGVKFTAMKPKARELVEVLTASKRPEAPLWTPPSERKLPPKRRATPPPPPRASKSALRSVWSAPRWAKALVAASALSAGALVGWWTDQLDRPQPTPWASVSLSSLRQGRMLPKWLRPARPAATARP